MDKSGELDLIGQLDFYWKTIRRLGPDAFTKEVGRKLRAEFRYRHFVSFARSAPEDYSPHIALKRMGRFDLERVVKNIRRRRFPLFFLENTCRNTYRECLETQGCLSPLLDKADRITQGYLSFFDHKVRWDTDNFDWQTDPLSGWRWDANAPLYLREKMASEVVVSSRGDVRVPWEISRLGCLVLLGQAWWVTGREEYSHTLATILNHWMKHNRPYRGVNWSSAMEAAIRAVNVIWAFFLFLDSPAATDEIIGKVLSFLFFSREFILGLLERHFEATGNHYIANLSGLLYIDLLFPDLSRFSQVDFAIEELAIEAENQVYPDGVHFESSTAYHGLVLEMFLAAALLCQKNGRRMPKSFLNTISQMASFTRNALTPSGPVVQIGDNDSGRLVELGKENSLEHSRWYQLAAAFNSNYTLNVEAPPPEILWYLGPESYQTYLKNHYLPQPPVSIAYSRAGLYFMKNADGWMCISCGPNGLYDRGAHAHNDKLSFELWYRGEPFLVDPGTCVYTGDPVLRNRLRSTAFHNTVRVDGEEQNRFDEDIFSLHNDSRARILEWKSDEKYDRFSGMHYGYQRLLHPVVHRRDILFDKKETLWKITDCFEGEGKHKLEWSFHIAPGIKIRIENKRTIRLTGKRNKLLIRFDEPAGICINDGTYSPGYRQQQPSKTIQRQITTIIPYRASFELIPSRYQTNSF